MSCNPGPNGGLDPSHRWIDSGMSIPFRTSRANAVVMPGASTSGINRRPPQPRFRDSTPWERRSPDRRFGKSQSGDWRSREQAKIVTMRHYSARRESKPRPAPTPVTAVYTKSSLANQPLTKTINPAFIPMPFTDLGLILFAGQQSLTRAQVAKQPQVAAFRLSRPGLIRRIGFGPPGWGPGGA
jgi:hypothetical protein